MYRYLIHCLAHIYFLAFSFTYVLLCALKCILEIIIFQNISHANTHYAAVLCSHILVNKCSRKLKNCMLDVLVSLSGASETV